MATKGGAKSGDVSDDVFNEVAALVTPWVEAAGFTLVHLQILKTPGRGITLQIMAERPDGTMPIEACVELSRALEERMEAHGRLAETYALEVSSPGVDRPLLRLSDYERFVGRTVRFETTKPVSGLVKNEIEGGRRRFCGMIESVVDDVVTFVVDGERLPLAIGEIAKARLEAHEALFGKPERKQRRPRKLKPAKADGDSATASER